MSKKEEIMQAVARGWGTSRNSKKVLDVELTEDISNEVQNLFNDDKKPKLGCATTRQLISEIATRFDLDHTDPDYRTIDD